MYSTYMYMYMYMYLDHATHTHAISACMQLNGGRKSGRGLGCVISSDTVFTAELTMKMHFQLVVQFSVLESDWSILL